MSGGSDKTTTTATSDPWKKAQPTLEKGLKGANTLYDARSGGDSPWAAYTESNVVPFSEQTQQGMGQIEGQANAATSSGALNNPMGFLGGLYDQGGLSSDQQGVADQWRNTASGSELSQTSPHFEDLLSRSLTDARTGVDLSISGSGRYGSGAHTGVLADRLGGISSAARQNEYNTQLGRQDSARGNLASLGQQGITNLFGAGQALPDAYSTAQMPATDLMKLGSMQEDLAARQKADQERIFREKQQSQLAPVEWLNAIGSGAGSLGSQQFGTSQEPSPNPFLQALGIGIGTNSLLDNPLGSFF